MYLPLVRLWLKWGYLGGRRFSMRGQYVTVSCMKFRNRTITELSELLCGNGKQWFKYYSQRQLAELMDDAGITFAGTESSRAKDFASSLRTVLDTLMANRHPNSIG